MNLARVVAEIEPNLVSLVLVTRRKENLLSIRGTAKITRTQIRSLNVKRSERGFECLDVRLHSVLDTWFFTLPLRFARPANADYFAPA